ncbi:cysteine desulfurase family protein [Ligilactobacillus sp. LYQ60]|uniref:cysteine desulfurase family protein n=1 Tax=unclassified Ligilactobacillus TaxID=2767920 RepID=UPI003852F520
MERIYLDNAATTPMDPAVIDQMTTVMKTIFGNASSVNSFGREARAILDDSRHTIAQSVNAAQDDEIVFTSGGTESDNTAILQTALARQSEGRHIITTAVEHEAVLKPMQYLERHGFEVTYLPVDGRGMVRINDLKAALRDDTILVSIMTGNNEVGARMPIHEIGELVAPTNAWFHTDAVQAYGLLDIDVQRDHIDLLATSAHKLNGPKFMGFLYRRTGLNFPPLIKGGEQELDRRAGTENIPAIAGFAKAVALLDSTTKRARREHEQALKEFLIDKMTEAGLDFEINGGLGVDYLPHVLSIWFKGIPNDALITNLDLAGIAVAAGSACTAGSLEPSHVLRAMYGDSPRISETIRFSFGPMNTEAEISTVVQELARIINRMKRG